MPSSQSTQTRQAHASPTAAAPSFVVAVVGATGAVGAEMARCLEQRNFPVSELRLLASARSVGKLQKFRGRDVPVQELTEDSFQGVQIALFSAGGSISKRYAPIAARAGAVVDAPDAAARSARQRRPDVARRALGCARDAWRSLDRALADAAARPRAIDGR